MPATTQTPPRDETGKFVKANPATATTDAATAPTDTTAKTTDKPKVTTSKNVLDWVNDRMPTEDGTELKKVEKTEDVPKETKKEVKKTEKPADKEPPKPAAKPVAKETSTAPDYEKISEAAARGVAKAMSKDTPKEEKKIVADPDEGMGEDAREILKVVRFLESSQPDKYKGAADKYKANLRKIEEYAAKWEKENPGQKFNPDDEEHTDFYDKNDLYEPWEDKDFHKAEVTMIAKELAAKESTDKTAELNKRLSQLEREKKALEEQPHIVKDQNESARTFWSIVGGDFDGLVTESGSVDAEKAKAIEAKMPGLLENVYRDAAWLDVNVENLRLLRKGLIDPVRTPPAESLKATNPEEYDRQLTRFNSHDFLTKFALQQEAAISSRPPEKQVDGQGRKFITNADYAKLPEDQRNGYWRLIDIDSKTGKPYLQARLVASQAARIRSYIEAEEQKFNAWAKARGMAAKESVLEEKKKPESKGDLKQEGTAEQVEETPVDDDASPSSGASPKAATSAETAQKPKGNAVLDWLNS